MRNDLYLAQFQCWKVHYIPGLAGVLETFNSATKFALIKVAVAAPERTSAGAPTAVIESFPPKGDRTGQFVVNVTIEAGTGDEIDWLAALTCRFGVTRLWTFTCGNLYSLDAFQQSLRDRGK